MRAVGKDIKRAALAGVTNKIQTVLVDSQVCVGAWGKGRSSSYKLNGIMRALLPYLIGLGLCIAMVWVSTGANPADYPSRRAVLPPPLPSPTWVRRLVATGSLAGLEVFAGCAHLTAAFREQGFPMLDPIDILYGPHSDIFKLDIAAWLREGLLNWIWRVPPCSSFSMIRNIDKKGPLRSKEHPAGNDCIDEGKPTMATYFGIMLALLGAWFVFLR